METNLLKTAFGGDKGPPTPPGIRMKGLFAASTGFSAEFFPESVILGCGPDSARAYPYTVRSEGGHGIIKVDAPDHPLTLTWRTDGSIDAGSGPYQVHGRTIISQTDDGDFTFTPFERTCELAVLTPAKAIPMNGGSAASAPGSMTAGGSPSSPAGPANATLSIVSGLAPQPGQPNPLAMHPYVLLRASLSSTIASSVAIPAGSTPHQYLGVACTLRTPDCQKIMAGIQSSAAAQVRADANGSATFAAVPAGTYYLMISARINNQVLAWEQPVQLHPGSNSITLSAANATPMN